MGGGIGLVSAEIPFCELYTMPDIRGGLAFGQAVESRAATHDQTFCIVFSFGYLKHPSFLRDRYPTQALLQAKSRRCIHPPV